ncbi:22590_t:CDS:2 [Entrophospora sp. SA101]|nr:22590_t:CDS:2 [Entrophospora sp. SA101]
MNSNIINVQHASRISSWINQISKNSPPSPSSLPPSSKLDFLDHDINYNENSNDLDLNISNDNNSGIGDLLAHSVSSENQRMCNLM